MREKFSAASGRHQVDHGQGDPIRSATCLQKPDLVFQPESTHYFIKWSWFCLAMSGKFLTPWLAINNWFPLRRDRGQNNSGLKKCLHHSDYKGAWLTKFLLCQAPFWEPEKELFHPPVLIAESFLLVSYPQSVHSPERQSSQSVESS